VAWLFGIAHHMTVDFHRRQRSTVALDFLPPILQPRTEHGLDVAVLHREDIERLRAVFATLRPDQRELLVLRFVAQLSVAEIAVVIGKGEAATQKKLHRLVRTVKEHYHDDAR